MGRGKAKGKKLTLTNNDDTGSGDEERIPAQKKRGRPQKPSVDETNEVDDNIEKTGDEDNTKVTDSVSKNDVKVIENGKKRKRSKQIEEDGDLVKEESENGTRSDKKGSSTQVNGFRHARSRRKSKPHRAAEAGVKCT